VKVLALSGGGSGGLATARYIQRLELRLGGPVHKHFDLISGVSTGSILAAALAGGTPAEALVELYKQELPAIFTKSKWKFWAGYLGTSRYSKGPLKDALQRLLPMRTLGEAKTGLMIHASQVAPDVKTKFWKSWKKDDAELQVVNCVAASCSAPTYFDPEEYLGKVFVDGGLTMNDPAAPAVAEAIRLTRDPVVCLSVQVSRSASVSIEEARSRRSAVDWLPSIFSDILSFGQDASSYVAETMLGSPKYLRVNLGMDDSLDAVGEAFNAKCFARADACWELSEDSVDALLERG